ncbi:MAG TPA: DUF4097 family beta strand repeat-containing protein, partial [Polyangiaceae bacterium]|nr:DUF4097 family beta strand repeat-containing protein [Polyangiaceae bacterium]
GQALDTRPASPRGVVTIEVISGTVRVVGWARNEVEVKGDSDSPQQFKTEQDRTVVRAASATLEIHVPAASTVELRGSHVDAHVRDVTGALRIDTISGDVEVAGAPASVNARTASGDVTIDGASAQINVHTISGDIHVRNARGVAGLETVSGDCSLAGSTFTQVTMRSTAGGVTFDGQLAPQASFEANAHSGDVTLLLPASTNGNFDLRSYHGSIRSLLGSARAGDTGLAFKAGTGSAIVRITTFSGDITINVRK